LEDNNASKVWKTTQLGLKWKFFLYILPAQLFQEMMEYSMVLQDCDDTNIMTLCDHQVIGEASSKKFLDLDCQFGRSTKFDDHQAFLYFSSS
jgi:hypothetical protein